MNYTIESDKTKLLLTMLVHSANEVLATVMEQKERNIVEVDASHHPPQPPPPTKAKEAQMEEIGGDATHHPAQK